MNVDLAIIGAGPAGLSAAAAAASHGLHTVVVDEYFRPGGRLLGQLYPIPGTDRWWNGEAEAARLVQRAEAAGAGIRTGISVWALEQTPVGWHLHLNSPGGRAEVLAAGAVLVATGAGERPLPVPGWTLPGVMTAGAAQVMVNLHRVRPGSRAVIVGMGPLAFAVAHELALAGVDVAGNGLPPPGPYSGAAAEPRVVLRRLAGLSHLAPSPLLRFLGPLGRNPVGAWLGAQFYPHGGLAVRGVPLWLRQAVVAIHGRERVERVSLAPVSARGRLAGPIRQEAADLVLLAGDLYPLAEVAAAAGCPMVMEPELGGAVPLHGPLGQTPLPGLYVAGNIMGVEGAPVAMAQGWLAGLAIAAARAGKGGGGPSPADLEAAGAAVVAARSAAAVRFYPGAAAATARVVSRWQQEVSGEGVQRVIALPWAASCTKAMPSAPSLPAGRTLRSATCCGGRSSSAFLPVPAPRWPPLPRSAPRPDGNWRP